MIRVVERIGTIFAVFTPEAPEHTLSEIAEATKLNKSTTYRLLVSMETIGLVERRDLHWRIGRLAVALANVRLGRIELREEAMHHLRELRQAFRAAVAFSVPDGSDMIYLERLDSPEAFGVSARLGGRAPIWAGGSGKAVLSRTSPRDRELRLDVPEWRRLPREVRERVLDDINEAALRGYCVDFGTFFDGVGGVAVAVRDAYQEPIAALSVILPAERLTEPYVKAIAVALTDAASGLESTFRVQ